MDEVGTRRRLPSLATLPGTGQAEILVLREEHGVHVWALVATLPTGSSNATSDMEVDSFFTARAWGTHG